MGWGWDDRSARIPRVGHPEIVFVNDDEARGERRKGGRQPEQDEADCTFHDGLDVGHRKNAPTHCRRPVIGTYFYQYLWKLFQGARIFIGANGLAIQPSAARSLSLLPPFPPAARTARRAILLWLRLRRAVPCPRL